MKTSFSWGKNFLFQTDGLISPECGVVEVRGDNGSGKTTLLRILAGRISGYQPEGAIHYGTHPLEKNYDLIRKNIGFIARDDAGFFPNLTGLENLEYYHRLSSKPFTILNHPLLNTILSCKYAQMSAGMKRTLALVKAFSLCPKVLILDEPTLSLDLHMRDFFLSQLDLFSKKSLVIFSSHHPSEWTTTKHVWTFSQKKSLGALSDFNPNKTIFIK